MGSWDIVLTPRGRSPVIILEDKPGRCWRNWSLFHLLSFWQDMKM